VLAQIFSAVLRKYFHGASAEVCLLLARAFYDADQMPQARMLNRASRESVMVPGSPYSLVLLNLDLRA
jgi:hypothetical protein